MAKVAIITLLYNPDKFVDNYLSSIGQLDYPIEDLSLCLLDNSPSDDYFPKIQEKIKDPKFQINCEIKLEKSSSNLGFSGGNNHWFEKLIDSEYDYFFLLNQDSEIRSDCISKLVAMADKNPQAGLVEAIQEPKEHPKCYDPETFETSWCSGGGVLIRRTALKEIGFFDHNFFLYCEDVDLSWRMWNANWKCLVCREAMYTHITEEADEDKDQSIRFFYSFRNGLLMHYKYDTWYGIFKHISQAFAVCFLQDPVRKKAFLKGWFAGLAHFPYYAFKKLTTFQENSKWITFNRFEYGERREFKDTEDGKRVFL